MTHGVKIENAEVAKVAEKILGWVAPPQVSCGPLLRTAGLQARMQD
jgi:hypothetical protein